MRPLHVSTFGRAAALEGAASKEAFAAEGLEISLDITQSSKRQMQELLDGVWQVVHTNADNVFWWAGERRKPVVIVLATPGRPDQDLLVRPEITSYRDLQGRRIAVDAAESGYATPLRLLLKQGGLAEEGKDYTFVEVGATQRRIDALRQGRAYAAMVGTAQALPLLDEGFRVLDSISRLYRHYAGTAAVHRDWGEANPDLLASYLRGYLRASGSQSTHFDWEGLREMIDMRRTVGLLGGDLDPRSLADDRFFRRATEARSPQGLG